MSKKYRYALFMGEQYYPSAGWHDHKASYQTLEEAIDNGKRTSVGTIRSFDANYDWMQVVDLEKQVVVYERGWETIGEDIDENN